MSVIYSAEAWKLLQGVVSLYKPPSMSTKYLIKALKINLVRDLNLMERRVRPEFLAVGEGNSGMSPVSNRTPSVSQTKLLEANLNSKALKNLRDSAKELQEFHGYDYQDYVTDMSIQKVGPKHSGDHTGLVDYSSHPKVLGPGYVLDDIQVMPANIVTSRGSGVVVLGINKYFKLGSRLRSARQLLTYDLTAEFGKATVTGFADSKTIAKGTWRHLLGHRWQLDHILANIEASHQKAAWHVAQLDRKSQEGYEAAAKGPVKPFIASQPIIYGIKCTDWSLPKFSVRIQWIGEDHTFLLDLISEIALRLRTHAHVTGMRCAQVGHFTADSTVVYEQLNLQNVLLNINKNHAIIKYKRPQEKRSNFVSIDQNNQRRQGEEELKTQEDLEDEETYGEEEERLGAEVQSSVPFGRFVKNK